MTYARTMMVCVWGADRTHITSQQNTTESTPCFTSSSEHGRVTGVQRFQRDVHDCANIESRAVAERLNLEAELPVVPSELPLGTAKKRTCVVPSDDSDVLRGSKAALSRMWTI